MLSHKCEQVFETQGRLPWLIWGNRGGREGGEELGRQKFAFIGELHSQLRFLCFYLMWAKSVIVSAEGGLTRYSMWLFCLSCVDLDMWMAACAGNIPETICTSLFPLVGTNSPASLQSSLFSNILLQACFVCKECLSTEGRPLWQGWQCSLLKKGIWWGRRESRLVSQSDSYFVSILITVSPENWNWDPEEQLGSGERNQVGSLMVRFVDCGY